MLIAFTSCQSTGGTLNSSPVFSGIEDLSVSGSAAAAMGGALSGSSNGGTLAQKLKSPSLFENLAYASGVACPTFKSSAGSGCAASGSTMWLSFSDCSFGSSGATWLGTMALTFGQGASSVNASCGSLPVPASYASPYMVRQFVQSSSGAGSTLPSYGKVLTADGTSITYNDDASNAGIFDPGVTVQSSDFENSGYGALIYFTNGARSSVEIAEEVTAVNQSNTTLFDHSIYGTVSITEAAGASTRIISSSLNVYHNLLKIVGTSTFHNVLHQDGCCYPVSGNITTSFAASGSVTPTALGQTYIGQTETLTFTGCGTGNLTDITGTTQSIKLTHCL